MQLDIILVNGGEINTYREEKLDRVPLQKLKSGSDGSYDLSEHKIHSGHQAIAYDLKTKPRRRRVAYSKIEKRSDFLSNAVDTIESTIMEV